MRVAQEPTQRPAQQADARLGHPGALRDERADHRWRELDQLFDPDSSQVALEAPQVTPVAPTRMAKTALTHQVLRRPGNSWMNRPVKQPAAASREPGNNKTKHLLDRATNVLDALARGDATELSSAIRGDPLGYERLDMSW